MAPLVRLLLAPIVVAAVVGVLALAVTGVALVVAVWLTGYTAMRAYDRTPP